MESNCPFCDRSKFEERLISEDADFYLVATLGQITDGGYMLLVPKRHVPCMAAMKVAEMSIAKNWLKCLWPLIKKEYGKLGTIFEHGIVGQTVKHAHLHILPVPVNLGYTVCCCDFPTAKNEVLNLDQLRKAYRKNPQPYLFWHNLYGYPRVCWNPPAPPQYLRIVVAEKLGRPERANWRNMDPELDKKLWSETVTRLKKYFEII